MAAEQNEQIEKTVRKERGRLFSFIRKRVPDTDDAEDILQDVFSQLVETYRGLETIERVTSWLFKVARNKITDLYRKRKTVPLESQEGRSESEDDAPIAYLQDILPDISSTPELAYMRDVLWAAIEEALDELPPQQREVFVWHELEGLSFKEMAELTGESENTLRMRKHYALRYLRERLEMYYLEL